MSVACSQITTLINTFWWKHFFQYHSPNRIFILLAFSPFYQFIVLCTMTVIHIQFWKPKPQSWYILNILKIIIIIMIGPVLGRITQIWWFVCCFCSFLWEKKSKQKFRYWASTYTIFHACLFHNWMTFKHLIRITYKLLWLSFDSICSNVPFSLHILNRFQSS